MGWLTDVAEVNKTESYLLPSSVIRMMFPSAKYGSPRVSVICVWSLFVMSKFARAASPGPPSRLAIPKALRASSSLTNLRVHSAGSSTVAEIPPVPPLPQPFLDSSASSVTNLEINDGILIDTEPDTADNDEIAITHHVTDEDSKKSLRDQLRRTLSSRPSMQGVLHCPPPYLLISTDVRRSSAYQKETRPDTNLNEISISEASKYPPREYFVLTDAGKPVFSR